MFAKYKKLLYCAVLVGIDAIFFSVIDPRKAPALVIVIGFGLTVITWYVLLDLLLELAERIVTFSVRARRRWHDALTMLGGLLLAMQSIGQLTAKDMLVLVPLVSVMAFYLSYQRKVPAV